MKIYNKKLAVRIADYEKRLHDIRSKPGDIIDAAVEHHLQTQINADVNTLRAAGYDRYGVPLKGDK